MVIPIFLATTRPGTALRAVNLLSSKTPFLVLLAATALTAGCLPPGRSDATTVTSAMSSSADSCAAVKPVLRRTATLFMELQARRDRAEKTLAGNLGLLHEMEQALGATSADLGRARYADPATARDAAIGARELAAAVDDLRGLRGRLENGVRAAATPLREAREKAWEMRTVCEAAPRKSSDCKTVIRVFAEGELAKWNTKANIEEARTKIARAGAKDAAVARDLGFVAEKLGSTAKAMNELAAVDLKTAGTRLGAHVQAAADAVTRMEQRCSETSSLGQSDWIAAPKGTDPRKLTVLVIAVVPDSMRKVFGKDEAKGELSMGSGSGAVVVRSIAGHRRAFVVTNRHVVESAVRTKVVLDGSRSLLDADVVYVDPHHDLAVLEVRGDEVPFEGGVELETGAPADQQGVVAAGFPAMGEMPSYQVTKGYVSNRSVRLSKDSFATYIQHTAPIDPGSSGGPLFSERGRLLGINTLKLRDREGAAFAVPADVVIDALRAAEGQHGEVNANRDARLACLTTLADLSTAELPSTTTRRLSARFVADVGPAAWDQTTKRLSADEQEEAAEFYARDPIGMLRWAALERLHASLLASGGVTGLEACEQMTMGTGKTGGEPLARFIVQTASGPRELKLVRERGEWAVESFDFRDAPAKKAARPRK